MRSRTFVLSSSVLSISVCPMLYFAPALFFGQSATPLSWCYLQSQPGCSSSCCSARWFLPCGRPHYQPFDCAWLLVRLQTIDNSPLSLTFPTAFYFPCHHSSSCLPQFDCKAAVEDHVASLGKVKVNTIHSSPVICRTSFLNTEGEQVGQVVFALICLCRLLSITLSLVLGHSSHEALLFSFARLWAACGSPGPPSFEDQCNVSLQSSGTS